MDERVRTGLTGRIIRRLAVGRHMSVWHFLVMIAVIPTLGLPALAAEIAHERLAEATTAARIEHDLAVVESVDQLRMALTAEAVTGSATALAKHVGIPAELIGGQLGAQFANIATARAAVDQALAVVPLVTPYTTDVVRFGTELSKLRAIIDRAVATPSSDNLAGAFNTNASYEQLGDVASQAEKSLAHHVGIGAEGVVSPALSTVAYSFDAACAVTISGGHRGAAYFGLFAGAPSGSDTEVLVRESQRYQVLTAQLDNELDPRTARSWHRLTAEPQFAVFDAALANGAAAIPGLAAISNGGQLDIATFAAILPTARAGIAVMSALSAFLHDAAQNTTATARADATVAHHREMQAIAVTGAIIAVTMVALFVVGGILRRRLKELAAGAQRLSAGYLEPVAVHGPRELAATSQALNAAVASLQHVEAKAILLASGDLNSAELEQPAPGPLGAAVHASVSRIVTAVREREELQLQLAHQASHDTLTGLPNRAELDRTLRAALGRAERNGGAVSVLFVDLDGFKACNDRLGHAAGDHILRETAQRLRDAIRPGDVVARLGGDEFVIVAEGAPPGPDTISIGERIVDTVGQPFEFAGQAITIGASVGLAGCEHGRATVDQLLSDADFAVYRAKAAGRGCVIVYHETLRTPQPAQT